MLDLIIRIFKIKWLWNIFAGFYLVAYAFWVPNLFGEMFTVIAVIAITLIAGFGLLIDGFSRAYELDGGGAMPNLPYRRVWRFAGAVLLFWYLRVYIPPTGRIVAHWPLDLAITLVAGLVMLAYGILDY